MAATRSRWSEIHSPLPLGGGVDTGTISVFPVSLVKATVSLCPAASVSTCGGDRVTGYYLLGSVN